ncbi:hypothetical protein NDU88_001986 [Pleurodeles waltl]|uniref:Uncharacterized protein n=1 Tax=Pleurodeles waltl TaxID=8319 RepID=A0AAV7KQY4_PLEWA|nr:hypothetical protein NDU88_001986 [Pleurodeles waltl]
MAARGSDGQRRGGGLGRYRACCVVGAFGFGGRLRAGGGTPGGRLPQAGWSGLRGGVIGGPVGSLIGPWPPRPLRPLCLYDLEESR